MAREAQLRDVVTRLEARLTRSQSNGDTGAADMGVAGGGGMPARVPMGALQAPPPPMADGGDDTCALATKRRMEARMAALGSQANKTLWELNRQLVGSLVKLGKSCLGNITDSLNAMGSQQMAEVRGVWCVRGV